MTAESRSFRPTTQLIVSSEREAQLIAAALISTSTSFFHHKAGGRSTFEVDEISEELADSDENLNLDSMCEVEEL